MTLVERERETALAREVQQRKAELLALLTPEEQRSRQAQVAGSDRTAPWTFEDSAQLLAQERADVRAALKGYQHAVNAMWIYLHSCEVSEKLYGMWKRKHRELAQVLPRDEIEAEILFLLRDAIRRYDPTKGAPFIAYATRVVFGDLVEWVRNQSTVVSRPRDAVLRKGDPPADSCFARVSDGGGHGPRKYFDKSPKRQDMNGVMEPSYTPNEDAMLEIIDRKRREDS